MRYSFKGRTRDRYGNVIESTGISIYIADTTTPAPIFTTFTGVTAISAAPQIYSDTNGVFSFYVDDTVSSPTTLFDLVADGITYEDIDIFRQVDHEFHRNTGITSHPDLDIITDNLVSDLNSHEASAGVHRTISDSTSGNTDLWSAYNIQTRIKTVGNQDIDGGWI